MDRVKIGIIGVGQIGKHHVEEYSKIPQAEMVAVCDLREDEANRVAGLHKIPHVYTDFRKMLQRTDIVAIDVCLHNNLHMPVTLEALRAGKHVYCEKPMAGAYVDAKAMYDEAAQRGLKLSIQLATLFSKSTKAAKRMITEGHLGRIYHARSKGFRRRGRPFVDGYGTQFFVKKEIAQGGALYDMGVYHIAQVLYLLGLPKVQRISGKVYQETDMHDGRRAESGYNVEELGMGFVKFVGGLSLDIIESWAVHLDKFDNSCILGSKAGIKLDPLSFHSNIGDVPADTRFELDGADWRRHQLFTNEDAYDSPQHHWVAALQGRVPLLPTAETALDTMLISEGIYLSDALGREVSADEVLSMSKSTAVKV